MTPTTSLSSMMSTQSSHFELSDTSLNPGSLSHALDQERAASMADEGGAAGAIMEAQEPLNVQSPTFKKARFPWPWITGGVALGAAAGALYLAYRKRGEPVFQPG